MQQASDGAAACFRFEAFNQQCGLLVGGLQGLCRAFFFTAVYVRLGSETDSVCHSFDTLLQVQELLACLTLPFAVKSCHLQ